MPDKMDAKAAARIAKARGKNDDFAKRADMASRNNSQQAEDSSSSSWRKDDSKKDESRQSKHK
ncbi:putative SMP domain-containing protein [Seiridium unicorne]|uniref:SMP domain-containing protein n=1 Tax=Seiridium unicorne TaxID=138068 RepID=A0ABR2VEL7_9PEZI